MTAVLRLGLGLLAGLLALQAVFLGLLVAAQAVPNRPIITHLAEAVESGDYGPSYTSDGFGGIADRFTECVLLGYGVSSPEDPRSVFYRATGGPRLSACDGGDAEIARLAAGERLVQPAGYYRYWSGYSVLTRPLLAVTDVAGVRLVVGGLFALAGLAAFLALARRSSATAATALLAPLVLSSNVMAMPATAFSHALALAAVAVGVALSVLGAARGPRGAVLGVAAAAALFCYVDLLTVPPMAWAVSVAAAGAVVQARWGSLGRTLRTVLATGAVWPAAFAFTWISRWVIAAAVQGPEVFTKVGEVAEYRVGGGDVSPAFGAGLRSNVGYWLQTMPTAGPVLGVAAVVVVVALLLALRRHGPRGPVTFAVLALPALVVPAWYCLLSNHSQVHAFFTYRSVPAAVGVLLLAAVVAAARRNPPGEEAPDEVPAAR